MSNLAEEFISKFHSLEGTTLAQKRRSFFTLLRENESLGEVDGLLDTIITNLKCSTFLENLYKLEFLIFFHRTRELYELLKEGNDIVISRIIREGWFLEEAFSTIGAGKLVNEVLPCLSFSARIKLLWKLCRHFDGEKFDEIYDAINARYGEFLALNFFIGCSPKKLREILLDYSVKLTNKHLMILHKKDPKLIEFLIDHNKLQNCYSYDEFRKYIYCNDRDLYDYMQNKKNLSQIKLGRRLTKKFIVTNKDNVIENPTHYSFLKMKVVVRKLGKNAERLFCNSLPCTIKLSSDIRCLLQYFPNKFHYHLLVKVVESHYQIKYIDCPSIIDENLLKIVPNNEERALLAKAKVDDGDDYYIKYLTIQDSIPKIKEKINFTSDITERGNLITQLIETCRINNNMDALLEVMKYFYIRHKNDDFNVHLRFINNIERLFGYKKFTEEMWSQLNDLLVIHMLKYDNDLDRFQKIQSLPLMQFNIGTSDHQKLSYLEFLFKKGEPIDELLLEFLNTNYHIQWGRYDQNFEKHILLFIINNINKIRSDSDNSADIYVSAIQKIQDWNSAYPNDSLQFYDFPELVHWFNHVITESNHVNRLIVKLFKNKIFTLKDNNYRVAYLKIYWKRIDKFQALKDFRWFLKYDPMELVNNFDVFMNSLLNFPEGNTWSRNNSGHFYVSPMKLKLWYILKKYSHLQLDSKFTEFCIKKIKDNEYFEPKAKFVACLSVIMEPEKFAELANSYKPANKKLDLKNETEVKLYNLQCGFGQHFKNTKSHKVLSSLLNYCAGDYFRYAMRSLYSIMYHTPENLLPQYLNYLTKKAISVRKHALYFTCELCTTTRTEEILQLLNQREGAESLRKYMFRSTMQYFIKNPSDPFFEMVKVNMVFIKESDDGSLDMIVSEITHVPEKYKSAYTVYSWEFLEKTVQKWNKLQPLKSNLLTSSTDNEVIMKGFPLDFILGIIGKHFLTGKKAALDFEIISRFMFSALSKRDEKSVILETILNVIKSQDRDTIFLVFNDWYNRLMTKPIPIKDMEPYLNFYNEKIDMIDDFCDYVKLFFLRTKLELCGHLADEFATVIVAFLNNLNETCGPHVLSIFFKQFALLINHFIEIKQDLHLFYYNLIVNNPTSTIALLILNVINKPTKYESKIAFNNILHIINEMNDTGIQIILKHKFKNYISSDEFLSSDKSTKIWNSGKQISIT